MAAILAIIDTRHRDDHGKIIPESGDAKECDLCGRLHEIHVVLTDGRIIGQGCAKKEGIVATAKRFEVREYETVIGMPKRRDEHRDVDGNWLGSLSRFALRNPTGLVEAFDRVTGMSRAVVAGGIVDVDATWVYRE